MAESAPIGTYNRENLIKETILFICFFCWGPAYVVVKHKMCALMLLLMLLARDICLSIMKIIITILIRFYHVCTVFASIIIVFPHFLLLIFCYLRILCCRQTASTTKLTPQCDYVYLFFFLSFFFIYFKIMISLLWRSRSTPFALFVNSWFHDLWLCNIFFIGAMRFCGFPLFHRMLEHISTVHYYIYTTHNYYYHHYHFCVHSLGNPKHRAAAVHPID